ncbi:MAG TPA: gephyrin-like molybdotransferase Glp [Chthoniobacterales bacterium]|nr:gephyrin-like molybdotransferase Glp [Chthoniobacterales bacterium]
MLLTEQETLQRVLDATETLATEEVSIAEAGDRVLANTLFARIALPAFNNSSMDGYALIAREARPGTKLSVVGEQSAGPNRQLRVQSGTAVRIFTGAPLPEGADAVLMQEDAERAADEIIVHTALQPAENVRMRGGDLCEGQKIGQPGMRLSPQRLALLASQGLSRVTVYRRPRVSVVVTGSELRKPDALLEPGEIYETNGIMLSELVRKSGGLPVHFDPIPDDEEAHTRALREALESDVAIIAGGVSVGEKDLVKPVLRKLGAELELWRVAIRPGKPFLFGRFGHKLIFGLPGNPVSAYVTFVVFVKPALFRLQGSSGESSVRTKVRVAQRLRNPGERPHYLRGRLTGDGFALVGPQESHALFALSQADALVRLEPNQEAAEGEMLEALLIN